MTTATPIENSIDVSVIIVNYNGGAEIVSCLKALLKDSAQTSREIIVSDNGSTDGSPAQITTQFPSVKLLLLGENKGFAAGCNAGIAVSRGSSILLLNPDTEVSEGAIDKLVAALKQHEHWGIVGAQMLNSTGSFYRAARRFPRARDLAFNSVGLSKLFPTTRYFNGHLYGEQEITSLDAVDQVEGSCLMISKAARTVVGPLDEQFFIFFEEVDWCKRVRESGFEVHIVKGATVLHRVSTTMSRYYAKTREYHAQSAMKYFLKHEGPAGYQKLRRAMKFALTIRAGFLFIPGLFGIGNMRRRFAGTLAERRCYSKGLNK